MVHIYTFCNKTLIGRRENLSSKFLCGEMYKLNLKVEETSVFSFDFDFSQINFKNKQIYFLLMSKSNQNLNKYLASLSGSELAENSILKTYVCRFFESSGLQMDANTQKEWLIPKNAQPIINEKSRTQGFKVTIGECQIFVLPNEVLEVKSIYYNSVLNELEELGNGYVSETYKTFGLTTESILGALASIINGFSSIRISVFGEDLDNTIVIKAKQNDESFQECQRQVYKTLEKNIYSIHGIELQEYLNQLIQNSNAQICFAGDATVACLINCLTETNLAGHLAECVILPTKSSCQRFVKNKDVVANANKVSSQTAYEIAVQCLNNYDVDLVVVCLSNIQSSVGENLIAIGNKKKIDVYKNNFCGTNETIKANILKSMMFYLIKKLVLNDYKLTL